MPVVSVDNPFVVFAEGGVAFPSVLDHLEQSFGSATTTHNVTMPATVNADELLLAAVSFNVNQTPVTPSGWTNIYNASSGDALLYAKKAVGDEDGTSVDFQSGSAATAAVQVFRITDWSGDLADITFATHAEGAGSSIDPPLVTAPWGSNKNLFMVIAHLTNDDATLVTPPGNYGNETDTVSGGGTDNGCTCITARRELQAASDDPGSMTISQSENFACTTVIIPPLGV